ncbi:MAG TPA: hypothetical protein VGU27_06835, partial [Candidatus Eisenbacteria bacterium]|nr:hypothetical protein [Candidatus Eisenbacteria bacterium]
AAAPARGAGPELGGSGEVLVQRFDARRQDGAPSALAPTGDLLRVALELNDSLAARLALHSEVEWEHAGVSDEAVAHVSPTSGDGEAELSGEATVEYAYVDWRPRCGPGVRAGQLLVPVGLVNEHHEPDEFLGARRPDVELRVIPTTWSALGAGVFGAWRAVEYRAYLLEGLDAARFTAADGIQDGRQGSAQAALVHPALAVRLDWRAAPGLGLGGSGYGGYAWQGTRAAAEPLHARTTLAEGHATLAARGLVAHALYAMGTIADHAALSRALGVAGTPEAIGRRFFGGYVEAAFDLAPRLWPGTRAALAPYARYEESDTQDGVGAAGTEDPAHHATTFTAGVSFAPAPGAVVKLDRQERRNETATATSQWNLALGWEF